MKKLPRALTISIIFLLLAVTLVSLSAASTAENEATTRFAVIGDYGEAGPDEEAVANLIHSWNVEFIATVGDNNYPDGEMATMDVNVGQYFQQYIKPYIGSYGPGSPDVNRFFPALGNHDWRDIDCDATGTTCTGAHFDYFALPGNERYYEQLWGPVHLFIINSNPEEPHGITSDSDQAAWLQAQLAASTAPWKLVFTHHAPYSSASRHGSIPELQWPYKEWGASAVFAGHDHLYERLLIDEFPYFVNGTGGSGLRGFTDPPLAGSEARYKDEYGAMLIEADSEAITFQFYNIYGELIDNFTLDAAAAPTPTAGCYALTLIHVGLGEDISASPSSSDGCGPGSYKAGTLIQLTAYPGNNARVANWSGTDNDRSQTLNNTVTMPANNHQIVVYYEMVPTPDYIQYLPMITNTLIANSPIGYEPRS